MQTQYHRFCLGQLKPAGHHRLSGLLVWLTLTTYWLSSPTAYGQSFSLVSGTSFDAVYNSSVAIADVDGDGNPDMLITGSNSSGSAIAKLYKNNGDGSFSLVSGTPFDGVQYSSVVIADVVGDSKPDVLITGLNSSITPITKLYENNGGGSFSEVSGTPYDAVARGSVAIADVDADGKPDVLITGQNSSFTNIAKLYKNNGNGSFSEVSGTPFQGVSEGSVAIADLDGDTKPDVLITGASGPSYDPTLYAKLYQNNGDGSFSEVSGTPFHGVTQSSVAIADVVGDSKPDVLITGNNSSGSAIAKLYQNNGNGSFSLVSGTPFQEVRQSSVAIADVDGDGKPDVLITGNGSSYQRVAKLYKNNGGGTFSEVSGTSFEGVANGSVAIADVVGSSKPDVLITGLNSSNAGIANLYQNTTEGCTPPSVSITATPSLTVTSGGSVTLTASGASSYTWSNGESTTAITVSSVTSATAFSVTGVTGACSSTASAAVSVTQAELPCGAPTTVVVNVFGDIANNFAYAGNYVLVGSANGAPKWMRSSGHTLQWSSVNARWQFFSADGTTMMAFSRAGSINNVPCDGWIATVGYVEVNPAIGSGCGPLGLAVTATPSLTITSGGSVTLTASGATSYTWSNGVQSTSVVLTNVTSATTLSVTGVQGGCSATASAGVSVTSAACAVTATISGNLAICGNTSNTLTASGAGAGGSYRWSTGETSATLSVNTDSYYSLTATTVGGCTATAAVTTTIRSQPTVSIVPTPSLSVCLGQSLTLTASATPGGNAGSRMATPLKPNSNQLELGASPGLSYTWSLPSSLSAISFTPTASTVLSVTVNDGYCSSLPASASVTVTPLPSLSIAATPSLTIASGGSVTLTASGVNSYTWSTGVSTTAITVSNVTSATAFSVTGTTGGCSATASAQVSVEEVVPTCDLSVDIDPSAEEVCENATLSLLALAGSLNPLSQPNLGGQARMAMPMLTYRWLSPEGAGVGSSSSQEVTASFTSSGVKTFTVIVTDANNCTATNTVSVTVKPLPTVTLAFPESAVVSPGPVITVPVGTGLSYQVFGGTSYHRLIDIDRINGFFIGQTNQSSTGVFPIDRAGTYTITVTGANGCSRTVTGVIVNAPGR